MSFDPSIEEKSGAPGGRKGVPSMIDWIAVRSPHASIAPLLMRAVMR
jgi:hypothetical protein